MADRSGQPDRRKPDRRGSASGKPRSGGSAAGRGGSASGKPRSGGSAAGRGGSASGAGGRAKPSAGGGRGASGRGRVGDSRASDGRPSGPRGPRPDDPLVPDEITGKELDPEVARDLLSLSGPMATAVSRHLVAAGELIDVDPATAYRHAKAAARRAGRVAVVREAAGLTAYRAGEYSDALKELRAHRRMTGTGEHLPVMADCERGLGRPQRALELAADPQLDRQPVEVRSEMRIVAAGARHDLGQPEAALVTLQGPELSRQRATAWWARLAVAYADALAALGRQAEAADWIKRAADQDPDGSSGAADRLGLAASPDAVDSEVIWQEDSGA